VMVLAAHLATGLGFVAIDGPLLRLALKWPARQSVAGLLDEVWNTWLAVLPSEVGVGAAFVVGMGALAVGLVVQPVATVYVTVAARLFEPILKRYFPRVPELYLPPAFWDHNYLRFADWIHRHPVEKAHYEWELYNHYLYAGVAFNVLVGFVSTSLLVRTGPVPVGLFVLVVSATGYSLGRGVVLRQVYDFYSRLSNGSGRPEDTAPGAAGGAVVPARPDVMTPPGADEPCRATGPLAPQTTAVVAKEGPR
jgi:hypothetical protein